MFFRSPPSRSGRTSQIWFGLDNAKKHLGESYGVVTLSHDCGSASELDVVIKQMHADLDDVLRREKLKFDAADRELRTRARHRWYRS